MRAQEGHSARSLVGVAEVAVAAGLWGCWSLFLRPSGLPALATAPGLLLVVGLVVLPVARRERPQPAWSRATLALLVVYAVADALSVLAFFAAMELTTVAIAVLTHYLMPLIVAVLAPLVERERVSGALAAALIASVGLVPVLGPRMIASRRELLGAVLGLLSALAYAGAVFLARRLMPRIGVLRTLSYHCVLAAAFFLPVFPLGAVLARPAGALLWVLFGMLLLGVTAGVLYMNGLARVGATRAAILTYFEPLVAVTVGWVVWRESLSSPAIVGAALVVLAGVWISCAPSRHLAEATEAVPPQRS